jgi:DNA-directed RNA polymerase specialized sigma24 family protein
MGGLAETELAEKLGVNKETGKIWVFRARAELKKLLRRARTTPIDSYHSLTLNAS